MKFLLFLSIVWTVSLNQRAQAEVSTEPGALVVAAGGSYKQFHGDIVKRIIVEQMDINGTSYFTPENKELFISRCNIIKAAIATPTDSEAIASSTTQCNFPDYTCEITTPYTALESLYMAILDWQNGYGFVATDEYCVSKVLPE